MATKSKKVFVKDINESNVTAGQQMMFGGLPSDVIAKANITPTIDKFGNVKFPKEAKVKAIGQYTPTGPGADADQTYSQIYVKDLGTVNGIRVYANYDSQGKLTGFDEGRALSANQPVTKVYENDKQFLRPKWDATGKATPVKGVDTKNGGLFSDFVSDVTSGFDDLVLQNPALRAAALAYAAPMVAEGFGASAGAGTAGGGAVDLGTATGADLSAAYDMGSVGSAGAGGATGAAGIGAAEGGLLTGATDAATIATGNADKAALYGDAGYGAGMTGAETTAYDTGLAAGTAAAGVGAAGAAGAGALGGALGDAGTAALIKGGAALAGGLLQGETSKTALTEDATKRAALAKEVKDMGKFTPVGITTTFGTSSFVTDPVTGTITPSYTLSPAAQAYQDSLGGLGTTALSSAKDIMSLGNKYIGESPEAVRKRYIDTQAALLQPGQEAELAKIRTNLTNTGRGGLSFGATSDGMAATNPELAAYYNSLAMTNRRLAADAESQYQNQVNFGTGLLGSATKPFTSVFDAQRGVETAGQQPLTMSTDFANTVATRGAAQGANYAAAMNPSLQSSYNAANYDPFATVLQGMSDSDLLAWGLSKIKP